MAIPADDLLFSLPLRLCVIGLSGKMGRELTLALDNNTADFQLLGGYSRQKSLNNVAVKDFYEAKNLNPAVFFTSDASGIVAGAEVIIDYSLAHDDLEYLSFLEKNTAARKIVFVGTSNISTNTMNRLRQIALTNIVFAAGNVSLTMALFRKISAYLAAILPNFAVEITDSHHIHKIDSPSGGALLLGKTIADARGHNFDKVANKNPSSDSDHHSSNDAYIPGEIRFHSIRSGSIIGDHEVRFTSKNESFTLKHSVHNRSLFAQMTLKIIQLLTKKEPGRLYNADDLIDFFLPGHNFK